MNSQQLEYFLDLCESGSFAKTSSRFYLTAQAIKKSIDALEAEVGAELFLRSNRGVELSEAGKAFYPYALKMTSFAEQASRSAQQAANTQKPKMLLGVTRNMGTHILPAILPDLIADYPHLDIELVDMASAQDASLFLEQERIHVTMTLGNEGADKNGVHYLVAGYQAPLVSVSAESSLAHKTHVSLADLQGTTVVIRPPEAMRWMSPVLEAMKEYPAIRIVQAKGNQSGILCMQQPDHVGIGPAITIPKWRQRVSIPLLLPAPCGDISIDIATNRPDDPFVLDLLKRTQVFLRAFDEEEPARS